MLKKLLDETPVLIQQLAFYYAPVAQLDTRPRLSILDHRWRAGDHPNGHKLGIDLSGGRARPNGRR